MVRTPSLVLLLAVILLIPAVSAGLSAGGSPTGADEAPSALSASTNSSITFISTQGGTSIDLAPIRQTISPFGQGRLVAVDTATNRVIWNHTAYQRYYDVDPLGPDRLLFVAVRSGHTYAVVYDWRAQQRIDRFQIPQDTHDVDALGTNQYVVADIKSDRIYIYNTTTDAETWSYNFSDHFPDYPTAGGPPIPTEGYTHVNDVDPVDGGQALLVSPRNFNRVLLINRSTKSVVWSLGEQTNQSILHKQHNPALINRHPPTVLVADSDNDRIVEYTRTDTGWNLTWQYENSVAWPRDADRLPNGNTLITDTYHQRVIEVSPNGTIAWSYSISKMPYDVERLPPGNEPMGPTMGSQAPIANAASESTITPHEQMTETTVALYHLGLWILPPWIGEFEFISLILGMIIFSAWTVHKTADRFDFTGT